MSTTYTVKAGESIWDVCLNATGSIANLNTILSANNLTDWTPVLIAGQPVTIPDTVVMDLNTLRQLQLYPSCNNVSSDVFAKIVSIFDMLGDVWILTTTFWNDNALWKDDKTWTD